jgi:Flp pilus assembly protein CpaB
MAAGTTRRTSRVTSRTTRAGGGGGRGGSAMGILMAIALVVVLLGGLAVYLQQKSKQDLMAANRTVGVVAAAVDLPVGHQITAQDVTIKQVKADSVEAGAYTDAGDPSLIGGTLLVNVAANQTVLRNYIGVAEEKLLPKPGEREATLVLKGSDAQQSFLRKGQIVSIFRIFSTKEGNRIMKSVSKNSRILDVQRNDNVVANAQNSGEPQATVTLAMPPDDAQKLLLYQDSNQIKLLDGPGQEPPPSQVGLLDVWMGIEQDPKEIKGKVDDLFMATETEKKQ